jgi:hypothetical protein
MLNIKSHFKSQRLNKMRCKPFHYKCKMHNLIMHPFHKEEYKTYVILIKMRTKKNGHERHPQQRNQ